MCFLCHRHGHFAKDCKRSQVAFAANYKFQNDNHNNDQNTHNAGACVQVNKTEHCECIKPSELKLACGKTLPIMSGACKIRNNRSMPVTPGYVGETFVETLRDTGCTGVVVQEDLVHDDQYLDYVENCLMIDGSVLRTPMAKITVDTPHFTGEVEAMVMKRPIYNLVIGNITGARPVEQPDPEWKLHSTDPDENPADLQTLENAEMVLVTPSCNMNDMQKAGVLTRAGSKKLDKALQPLKVVDTPKLPTTVNVQNLIKWQKSDTTLNKIRTNIDKKKQGDNVRWFDHENYVLYRYFQSPKVNCGNTIKQVVVPKQLREQVMMVGHDSVLAGHMGVQKTLNRIQIAFYWPGMDGDIRRYCKSCDLCQRTVPRGKVQKIPLGEMPRIDTPFKRVAIDLVGPITPMSDRGYRYILTLVDYATRYPEAIPLKHITTEDVAEALLSIYSRVGFPEEILSDLGTQFTSALMDEINRLLSIKRLNSTPYHPICNGLVEKMNGSLKAMLKKLAVEKPQDWDRYLNAILFAYREVPQDSTGYAPFELLYGRAIRGPMSILKQCWTEQCDDDDVKNSYDYVIDLKNRISETCEMARTQLLKSQKRYKKCYDRKARSRKYRVGDQVLILLPTSNNKLLLQWKGPFSITECVTPNDYALDVNGKRRVFHANMLKQYFRRVSASDNIGASLFQIAATSIIECDEINVESENFEMRDEEFLCFSQNKSDENIEDVMIDDKLSKNPKADIGKLLSDSGCIFR